jgi:hypothetical protein
MEVETRTLYLDTIRLDEELQPRAAMDQGLVEEYAQAMEAGDTFPPVTVYYDGAQFWLADGWHRVEAARTIRGQSQILAEVHEGSRRDALLHSLGANAQHGLRRSNEDKRRSVARLLADEEWAAWSDREIARRCRVSHPLVAKIRAEMPPSGNVSRQRTFERGGTVSTMDTAPIAEANEARAAESVHTEPRETKPYPGLNDDACDMDRDLLTRIEQRREEQRQKERESLSSSSWVPSLTPVERKAEPDPEPEPAHEPIAAAKAPESPKPPHPWAPSLTPKEREARVYRAHTDPAELAREVLKLGAGIGSGEYKWQALAAAATRLAEHVLAVAEGDGSHTPERTSPTATPLPAGSAVTWAGKRGVIVEWGAKGRVAVVEDEAGGREKLPAFMLREAG